MLGNGDNLCTGQIRFKLGQIEVKARGIFDDPAGERTGRQIFPGIEIDEQEIVHLPEFTLQPGGFGGLGGEQGFIVDAGKREMAVNNTDIIRIIVLELRQHGRKISAVRSLKIAVLDDGHRRGFRAFDPVIFGNAKDGNQFSWGLGLVTNQGTFHLRTHGWNHSAATL